MENEVKDMIDVEERVDEEMCVICKEYRKDYTESKNSHMCGRCRDKHKRLNIPFKVYLFLIAICITFAFTVAKLPPVLEDYRSYKQAEEHMNNKEYSLAYYKYKALLDKYGNSLPIAFDAAEAAMRAQYFRELSEVFDVYIADKDLESDNYKRASEYYDLLNFYAETHMEIDSFYKEADEKALEALEESELLKLKNKISALLEKEHLDKTQIYFALAGLSTKDEDSLKYIELSLEIDSRFTYPYSYYGNILRNNARFEEARSIYNIALEKNATDALSIRGLAILDLLEDKNKEALEKIRYAYELEKYYDSYIAESLVIILYENKLKEEADTLLQAMINNKFVIEEDFQKYLDGEITFKDYYIKGVSK